MIKNNFSNIDAFIISKELNENLSGAKIINVYQVYDLLILKIDSKNGKQNLIIKKDERINLTDYNYPIPKFPSQYIISLRKFLKNRRIFNIYQHYFDRIIIIELSGKNEKPWRFIIELFNKGNYILVDENNIIKVARNYKKFKDREILANREYTFPKSRGLDFLKINKNNFFSIFKENSNTELVRIIARNINISGLYSEELCFRAGFNKKILGINLNEDDIEKLYENFKKLRNQILFGDIHAQIIFDKAEKEISVVPFDLEIYQEFKKKYYDTFNKAVDDFYSKIDSKKIKTPYDQKINDKIKSQERILKNQMDYLEELKKKKQKYYKFGDFIYGNFNSIEKLISVIINARKKGYSWEEINEKLQNAKNLKMEDIKYFEKIIPSTKELIIKINNENVSLDLNKSLGENANQIYLKGKKADKKIKGTIPAIEKTKQKIKNLRIEKESLEFEIDFLIKKPKKKWFEKFRWFKSSNGFLVIGGRDASSNEIIFKKYLDMNDLVFHTTFPGSPLTVIKNPDNKQIPKTTIQETASFVASYSRAWKETWGYVDIFYVNANQVSKTPPTGEYLAKGSFMITGKRNIVKNAKIELAIGLELKKNEYNLDESSNIYYPKIICGPKSAIQAQTNKYLIIVPSRTGMSKGKLAKEIKSHFLKIFDEDLKKWIKLLTIEEINLYLPTGNSIIKK
ncbi:MAG: ribosome rescue protein RqcH [Promethearchaeota archaeon]